MPDLIESHDAPRDEEYLRRRDASFLRALLAPPALALAAFALAVSSLLGVYVLSGSTYLGFGTDDEGNPSRSDLAQAGLLGAAFAGLIVCVSYTSWRRASDDGPSWVRALALAAALVALSSLTGRLVLALLHASGHGPTTGYGL